MHLLLNYLYKNLKVGGRKLLQNLANLYRFLPHKKNILYGGKMMDKFSAVDKFRNLLMEEFLELCGYNDFRKINLLLIEDTINKIYDKCIEDMTEDKG